MKKPKYPIAILLFVVTMMLAGVLVLSSCQSDGMKIYKPIERGKEGGYNLFQSQKGEPFFVFEYPDYLAIEQYEYNNNPRLFTSVYLSNPDASKQQGKVKSLDVSIFESVEETKKVFDDRLAGDQNIPGMMEDFKLLESTQVSFSGLEGWESICSQTIIPHMGYDRPFGFGDKPTPIANFDLVFEYSGNIGIIYFMSDLATYKQAKKDFEHIIRTFQFLE
jgi:hypothetical protein